MDVFAAGTSSINVSPELPHVQSLTETCPQTHHMHMYSGEKDMHSSLENKAKSRMGGMWNPQEPKVSIRSGLWNQC